MSHVLITGCSSGIGRATVEALARAGHQVFATARRVETIADLRGERVETGALDVTDAASIRACVEAAQSRAAIDILINNAGYGQFGPLLELSHEEVRAQFETNVFGLLELTRAVVMGRRGMIARGSGRIVNISSVVSQVAVPFNGIYSASKFALRGLSDALRIELRPFGITVVQVEPGRVQSRFAESAMQRATELIARRDSPWEFARPVMERRLSRPPTDGLPAADCARVILRAATAANPANRYTVTSEAKGLKLARAILPEKTLDWILARVFGLNARRQ